MGVVESICSIIAGPSISCPWRRSSRWNMGVFAGPSSHQTSLNPTGIGFSKAFLSGLGLIRGISDRAKTLILTS